MSETVKRDIFDEFDYQFTSNNRDLNRACLPFVQQMNRRYPGSWSCFVLTTGCQFAYQQPYIDATYVHFRYDRRYDVIVAKNRQI